MFLAVFVLTFLVAIINALAGRTLLDGITLLTARRAELGWGPVFRIGFGFIIRPFRRFTERHGTELLSRRRCITLFR